MSADAYPPVMNTNFQTLFKVVGVHAVAQSILIICIAAVVAISVYLFGISSETIKSFNPLVLVICGLFTVALLLIPVKLAVSRYHNFSRILPNGEARLTLAMLIALFSCCLLFLLIALLAPALIGRLVSGDVHAYELLFALSSMGAIYMINFIIAVIGIRMALRRTKDRFTGPAYR